MKRTIFPNSTAILNVYFAQGSIISGRITLYICSVYSIDSFVCFRWPLTVTFYFSGLCLFGCLVFRTAPINTMLFWFRNESVCVVLNNVDVFHTLLCFVVCSGSMRRTFCLFLNGFEFVLLQFVVSS